MAPPAEDRTGEPLDALLRRSIALMDGTWHTHPGIRELKADRQSLVYNHHQELVAASETVGKMRAGLDALHTPRDALRAQLAAIDHARAAVAADGVPWADVRPIVDLPATLERLAASDPEKARAAYAEHEATLRAWEDAGVGGADTLRAQCEAALEQ
ncbi:hypothetical protein CBS9595_002879 [Malassezia furfur]|nr:hypothetical protein CBS9595_002879 [Malassezia furfur]